MSNHNTKVYSTNNDGIVDEIKHRKIELHISAQDINCSVLNNILDRLINMNSRATGPVSQPEVKDASHIDAPVSIIEQLELTLSIQQQLINAIEHEVTRLEEVL